MDDNKIIDLFFLRSEQAIAELERKYGPLTQPSGCRGFGQS